MAVLIGLTAPAGCDYLAPSERLVDPEAISIALVLLAGERHAHLLAGHPFLHRSDPPPEITATLIGPGWRATFAHRTDPQAGCGRRPDDWPIPMVCLNAVLPEPILEETAYQLEGSGPKGPFTGEAVVPAAPLVLDPVDTVWLPSSTVVVEIPIRYRAPPEVGTLRPEVFQTVRDGGGSESRWIRVFPRELLVNARRDIVVWQYTPRLERASLHLLGIGTNYSHFWRMHESRLRWERAGISGEGVYGYFAGSARSLPVEVRLEDGR